MDPSLQPRLAEMRRRDLLAEARERRLAARVQEPFGLRTRAGHLLLTLGATLLRTGTAGSACAGTAPLTHVGDACRQAVSLCTGQARPLCPAGPVSLGLGHPPLVDVVTGSATTGAGRAQAGDVDPVSPTLRL